MDLSLRPLPPPEKRQFLKIPEIDFFSKSRTVVSICFRSSEVREGGPILDSRPAITCYARAAPPTKYQMHLPKATLSAVSDRSGKKERTVAQYKGKVWYILDTKSGKKSIFFRGWRNVTGQNPLPPNVRRTFSGKKIDL